MGDNMEYPYSTTRYRNCIWDELAMWHVSLAPLLLYCTLVGTYVLVEKWCNCFSLKWEGLLLSHVHERCPNTMVRLSHNLVNYDIETLFSFFRCSCGDCSARSAASMAARIHLIQMWTSSSCHCALRWRSCKLCVTSAWMQMMWWTAWKWVIENLFIYLQHKGADPLLTLIHLEQFS